MENALLKIIQTIEPSITKITLTKPPDPKFGDISTNIALQLSSKLKKKPNDIALLVSNQIKKLNSVKKVEIINPGFINIFLSHNSSLQIIKEIIKKNNMYGHSKDFKDLYINLEYVSANPTGPLHLASGRWAAIGSSLSKLLELKGAKVMNEYYINDAGVQIDLFNDSLYKKFIGEKLKENNYKGKYLDEIISIIEPKLKKYMKNNRPNKNFTTFEINEIKKIIAKNSLKIMLKSIKDSLINFKTHFNVFFHESDLYKDLYRKDNVKSTKNSVESTIESLKEFTYKKDNALWLKTSLKNDSKDRVLIKTDNNYSYFASDIAYMDNKIKRGFNKLIYIFGADHHGYTKRLEASFSLLTNSEKNNIEILIGQLVKLSENNNIIKMSKRSGNIITLDELTKKIGVDASRYAFLRSSINSPLEIDIDLWKKQSNENPVYYIQYAHARCSHIEQRAKRLNISPKFEISKIDFEKYLSNDQTKDLLGNLNNYSKIIDSISVNKQIHKLPRYLENLSASFHKWYKNNRVIPTNTERIISINNVRLAIVIATKIIIKNGLSILKISSPNQM